MENRISLTQKNVFRINFAMLSDWSVESFRPFGPEKVQNKFLARGPGSKKVKGSRKLATVEIIKVVCGSIFRDRKEGSFGKGVFSEKSIF